MRVWKQNDLTLDGGWGPKSLGRRPASLTLDQLRAWPTIGAKGCALVSLTHAVNQLRPNAYGALTPWEAQEIILAHAPDAFYKGVNLVWEKAAPALGLSAPERARVRAKPGDPALAAAAIATLAAGGVPIIHVDTDHTLVDGDPEGEHFISCARLVGPTPQAPRHFECLDSAPGITVWLDDVHVSGTSPWSANKIKKYAAVSVIPATLAEGASP